MYPLMLDRNFNPSSMAPLSVCDSICGVAPEDQMLRAGAPVVKDQVTGAIAFPPVSVAPLTVTLYSVSSDSKMFGWKVAVRVGAS